MNKIIKLDIKALQKFAKDLYQDAKQVINIYLFSESVAPFKEEHDSDMEVFQDQDSTIRALVSYLYPIIKFGLLTLLLFIAIFFVWGGLAPLDSASVAPGFVILGNRHKAIQHLEGGIVSSIQVREGDYVIENQILLTLQNVAIKSRSDQLYGMLVNEQAMMARLEAERDNLSQVQFPRDLLDAQSNPEVAKAISVQDNLFKFRAGSIQGQTDILNQGILQIEDQINGLESQKQSVEQQIILIKEELGSVQQLFDKGLAVKSRLLELKRSQEDLQGREGQIVSNIAAARNKITESKIEIYNIDNKFSNDISENLKQTQSRVIELSEQLNAARDALFRTIITAPIAGVVSDMKVFTVGGVINQGFTLMDIVPQNDNLLIEAAMNVQDINNVQVGQRARVNLSAYKARLVPRIEGTVVYVSADTLREPPVPGIPPGYPYYKIRVEVPKSSLESLSTHVELYPGMPAEVFIITGTRTMIQYLLTPVVESFHRAFVEE